MAIILSHTHHVQCGDASYDAYEDYEVILIDLSTGWVTETNGTFECVDGCDRHRDERKLVPISKARQLVNEWLACHRDAERHDETNGDVAYISYSSNE